MDTWNKLSKPAKIVMVELLRYIDVGRVDLNNLRMSANLRDFTGVQILMKWRELADRGFGEIETSSRSNPVFKIDQDSANELADIPEEQVPKHL